MIWILPLYLATRGNAIELGLNNEIGTLEPGHWTDLVVLGVTTRPVFATRDAISRKLEDTLFALTILEDDRAVCATYSGMEATQLR